MIEALLGLPGKIKSVAADVTTLLGRLTSGRAGNLDNLNATVSSRVASSVWTNAKAAFLDVVLSSRASQSSLDAMAADQILSLPPVNTETRTGLTKVGVNSAMSFIKYVNAGAMTAGAYITALNITASKGVVDLAFGYHVDTTSHALTIRITIDGVVVREYSESTHTSSYYGVVGIGGVGLAPEKIPFRSSLKIEIKSDTTLASGKVRAAYNYWLV